MLLLSRRKIELKRINTWKDTAGYTLAELMVVVVILGVLTAVALIAYSNIQLNASLNAHNANVRILESAARIMYLEGHAEEEVTWDKNNPEAEEAFSWRGYLTSWPDNPFSGKPSNKIILSGDEDDEDIGSDYKVTIKTSGEITVTPGLAEKK